MNNYGTLRISRNQLKYNADGFTRFSNLSNVSYTYFGHRRLGDFEHTIYRGPPFCPVR